MRKGHDMNRTFLIGVLYAFVAVLPGVAFAENSCDSQAVKNPCDHLACDMAKAEFRKTNPLSGEVSYLFSQWGFLSDIPIYSIYVTVSAKDGNSQNYMARLEANQ
jgi:hypothetical protein